MTVRLQIRERNDGAILMKFQKIRIAENANLRKSVSAFLFGLSIFLALDASLAIFLGKQYVYWNLEYLPAWYGNFMVIVYESTQPVLQLLILTELAVGFGSFLVARKLT